MAEAVLGPCGCGLDVTSLPQTWHCEQGVLLQEHLLKPPGELWEQGWCDFQCT